MSRPSTPPLPPPPQRTGAAMGFAPQPPRAHPTRRGAARLVAA
eukprot:SAG31_NODE_3273_length_4475_cov_14.400137_5_plen_42_part_01